MENTNDSQENKNTVQDHKSMWKHLKQQKKEAKKAKNEEEFLANLRKPKDTKVVLADKSFVEKLRNQNAPCPAKQAPGFRSQDFPALPTTVSFPKPPPKESMAYSKAVNNTLGNCYFPSVGETTEKRIERKNNCDDLSLATAISVTDHVPPEPTVDAGDTGESNRILNASILPKKRIKRKDPLVLYSHDLISQLQKKSSKADRKNLVFGSKYRRKPEVGVLYGNMLDSSNPIRKRGKHREIKKVKHSKLKFAIIRDRILDQKARNNQTVNELMDRKQLKTEIDEYLSNLTKKKLELAEKRKRSEENKTEEVIPEEKLPAESKPNEKNVKKKPPKYRKYCDNCYTEGLDTSVRNLITGIVYLQDRAFKRDAIKARAKQKHVVGFREVNKYLMLKKIQMIIVAPDLEAKDAVTNVVEDLKKNASLQKIPCVFALSRRMLGRVAKKTVPVSVFGIMNYDGLEDKFMEVKENLIEAQEKYKLKNGEIGNVGSNLAEVIDEDMKTEFIDLSNKSNAGKEHDLVPHTNKKKTKSEKKGLQLTHEAQTVSAIS